MSAGNKAKGTRREHQAMRALEAAGYYTTRAAGSLGMFDVVAVPATPNIAVRATRLVQVKSNRWPGRRERRALEAVSFPGSSVEIWRKDDRARDWRVLALGEEGWCEIGGNGLGPVVLARIEED